MKPANTIKDYLFYGTVGLLLLSAVGSVALMFEDPDERAARVAAQQEAAAAAEARAGFIAKAQDEAIRKAAMPKLRLGSFKCSKEYGYAKVTGEVTNRTDAPIERLMVVAIFRTSSDEFVKSADAMVDYQPLMAGQTSPFTAMTTDNPAMKNCNVAFKQMFGGEVSFAR